MKILMTGSSGLIGTAHLNGPAPAWQAEAPSVEEAPLGTVNQELTH